MDTILCKFRGMLVLMEVTVNEQDKQGTCPDCGDNNFHRRNGWVECDCGFAVDESAYDKLIAKRKLIMINFKEKEEKYQQILLIKSILKDFRAYDIIRQAQIDLMYPPSDDLPF